MVFKKFSISKLFQTCTHFPLPHCNLTYMYFSKQYSEQENEGRDTNEVSRGQHANTNLTKWLKHHLAREMLSDHTQIMQGFCCGEQRAALQCYDKDGLGLSATDVSFLASESSRIHSDKLKIEKGINSEKTVFSEKP